MQKTIETLTSTAQQSDTSKKDIAELRGKISNLSAEVGDLTTRYNAEAADADILRARNDVLEAEKKTIEKKIQESQRNLEAVKENIDTYRAAYKVEKNKVELAEIESARINRKIEAIMKK
jgi:uncharacterized protein involved in exopolysaccharide biosynthesis